MTLSKERSVIILAAVQYLLIIVSKTPVYKCLVGSTNSMSLAFTLSAVLCGKAGSVELDNATSVDGHPVALKGHVIGNRAPSWMNFSLFTVALRRKFTDCQGIFGLISLPPLIFFQRLRKAPPVAISLKIFFLPYWFPVGVQFFNWMFFLIRFVCLVQIRTLMLALLWSLMRSLISNLLASLRQKIYLLHTAAFLAQF